MRLSLKTMKKQDFTIAVLIPAHNEELCLARCIESCLNQTRKPDQIVVVNDGSTDRTAEVVARFGNAVDIVTISQATGNKSRAQEIGLKYVTTDIFIATDADTVLDEQFIEYVECSFIKQPNLAAVAGYVRGNSFNYLTAIREIDYVIGQDLYKSAQSYMNYIYVIAGCAGAFKTKLFQEKIITFDHDTLTEDLDFTFKLHHLKLPIKYNVHALCYTQDPHTLHSYVNQMRRWYAGSWQNIIKHAAITVQSPGAALFISINYLEGLFFPAVFLIALLTDFYVFMWLLLAYTIVNIFMGLYAALRRRDVRLFLYSPMAVPVRFLHAYLYVEQFVKEVFLRRKKMVWFTPERRAV